MPLFVEQNRQHGACVVMIEDTFSIGIEEEYILVDPETRDVVASPSPSLLDACKEVIGKRVGPELMRCQIEIGTGVCQSTSEARAQLTELRGAVRDIADEHGCAFIAASTHPFAEWRDQKTTPHERYQALAADLRSSITRMLICGMHVHVGIEDEALRHDIFSQAGYFMPHLLALSVSSPFWRGTATGLSSFRLAVFDGMPRSGLPESFASGDEYRRTVDILVKVGQLEDASKIWWDLRPSVKYPTLEMRITDMCPRLEDAVAIASAYRCLCRMLTRLRQANQRWRDYSRFLVAENRWLAQRGGVTGGLIDFGRGEIVPFAELAEELITLTAEDAAALGCGPEMEHLRTIVRDGTSADRQVAIYEACTAEGATSREAMNAVVDHLIEETARGLPPRVITREAAK